MVAPPTHYVNIYDNPLSSTGTGRVFKARYQAYNYTHTLNCIGGFDSMTCDILCDRTTAELIYQNFRGNRIAAFVDSPEFIWEGFINRITYIPGNREFTVSFDDMMNRVKVTYYNNATPATTQTAAVDNTTSQALYGVKDGNIEADIHYNANVTQKTAVRDLNLAQKAYPLMSSRAASGAALLRLECLGFFWLWDWNQVRSTSTTLDTASTYLANYLTNTALFVTNHLVNEPKIYQTGTSATGAWAARIQTNSAFSQSRENTSGQTLLELVQAMLEAGDGSARWVLGITPLDHLNGTAGNLRYVYYKPAETTYSYTAKALSEPGIIRDKFGRQVSPWEVKADKIIKITDVLVGYDFPGDDPRQTYIEAIQYDAEAQSVSYQGSDDITNGGAFGLRRRYKIRGRRLKDAPLRLLF